MHTGRRWYLVAYDMDREDWRTFRVDRISDARGTGMRSARRPAPDPVDLINRGVAVEAYIYTAEVILDCPLEVAQKMIPITVGRLEAKGKKRTLLHIGADNLQWLARYLVASEIPFEVVSPDELRAELVELGRQLIARHGG